MDCVEGELSDSGPSNCVSSRPAAANDNAPVLTPRELPAPNVASFAAFLGGPQDDEDDEDEEEASWPDAGKWWLCRTCEGEIGVATSLVEPVWQAPLRVGGNVRLASGRQRLVCSHCKLRGTLTFVE